MSFAADDLSGDLSSVARTRVHLQQPQKAIGKEKLNQQQNVSAATNKEPDDHQRGTEAMPLAVKILTAPPDRPETTEQKKQREEKEANDSRLTLATEAIADFTHGLEIASIIAAIIGVGQLLVFIVQLKIMGKSLTDAEKAAKTAEETANATKETVSIMKDTSEKELRAYVLFESARANNIEIGKIPYVNVIVRNFGKTPARIIGSRAIAGFGDYPPIIGDPPPVDSSKFFPFTLAPGSEYYAVAHFNHPLRQIEIDNVTSGKAALYAFGEISYEDAFGKIRRTKYKLFSGGPIGLTDSMAAWKDGNEYD